MISIDGSQRPLISHIRTEPDGTQHERPLLDHLQGVAKLTGHFAAIMGAGDWGELTGRWHDLGKYRPAFQRYIRAVNGVDAHIEHPGKVDHSTVGAVHAVDELGQAAGGIVALLIAGHHAGLPDYEGGDSGSAALLPRLQHAREMGFLQEVLGNGVSQKLLESSVPQSKPRGGRDGLHLWLRMLFSCLVDADFLDTERFMDPDRGAARPGFPDIAALGNRLDSYMETLMAKAALQPNAVTRLRAHIYQQCCDNAEQAPGIYSLTVPTGGGKTLASLAFALRHAEKHGKRRVIYAIPFTSIIEQTAAVFREALDDNALIEHHSNAETAPERESHRSRLACENWDAPLVITTNVQLFESLFAARTSRCRKLHNLIGSVIVLDEAQALPPQYLQPITHVMRLLVEQYDVTILLCTATQPDLSSRKGLDAIFEGLDNITEIVDDVPTLYQQLKRVEIELPKDLQMPTDWPVLTEELAALEQSLLCIVNTRAHCRQLYDLLCRRTDQPVYHLSALMCGQHRSETIAEIKQALGEGKIIKVVSTQLVEAGVDLDFPVVYRALGGLDAIAQAAGRCNREGRLSGLGRVKIFVAPDGLPPGQLHRAATTTRSILTGHDGDPLAPSFFQSYFQLFYGRSNTDEKGIMDLLNKHRAYRTAAERFRLIDDYNETLFVSYGEKGAKLIGMLKAQGPERWLMRKLQRYAVNVPPRTLQQLLDDGQVIEQLPGLYIQISDTLYDPTTGINTELPTQPLVV